MSLGPRAGCAYQQLHTAIITGQLAPGAQLPPQLDLAATLGVSLLTLRRALVQLEREGWIISRHGRGTFVGAPVPPRVLILEDEPLQRAVLTSQVEAAGYMALPTATPAEALAALAAAPAVGAVLTDLRVPAAAAGIDFIRQAARARPEVPVVAVTGFPHDLQPLQGTPEHPVLILTKPVIAAQIAQVLRYVLGHSISRPRVRGNAVATGDQPPNPALVDALT